MKSEGHWRTYFGSHQSSVTSKNAKATKKAGKLYCNVKHSTPMYVHGKLIVWLCGFNLGHIRVHYS